MKQPGKPIIALISLVCGALIAFVFLWIFGIKISDMERFRAFPEGWTIFELAFNATAFMLLIAATRAVYKGLQEYYNPSDDDRPPTGGGY